MKEPQALSCFLQEKQQGKKPAGARQFIASRTLDTQRKAHLNYLLILSTILFGLYKLTPLVC